MKKFNGHRCERRNLTDLVLGTGPDGKPRPKPKAKKRPKNFTKEPAANKKYFGGPYIDPNQLIQGNPSLGYGMTLADPLAGIQEFDMPEEDFYDLNFTPGSVRRDLRQRRRQFDRAQKIADRQAARTAAEGANPGQVPNKMAELLEDDAKAAAISAGGQAAGEFIIGMDKRASDPGAKYGVGEGAGALIKGATNPLAMAFGPAGMAVGAALNLGASIFKHKKEKDEFELAQEEAREERIANEMAAAQSFSDQVLQTYSQEGVGGGLYARHGGPVDRFYTGGPTEPPVESVANPMLAPGIGRNEGVFKQDNTQRDRTLENVREYASDNPLDAAQLGLAIGGQIPVLGEPLDLANAVISGGRGIYNTAIGDTDKAAEQFGLAALSGASVIPFFGNVPALGRIAHGAHKLERGVIAGKGVKAATYDGYEMGGPVDYETEKSEVILASPNDPPVAVGQGKYTQVSENLYRAKGPSHKHGGIPTRGATEPFVDNMGMYNDSPYVFSDAKEMRFDPSEILSMIA